VSERFGQAKVLMNAPAAVQKRVLSLLYGPTQGAGLTILRNEISADAGFTIEPKAPMSPAAKPAGCGRSRASAGSSARGRFASERPRAAAASRRARSGTATGRPP